ncbi:MAG: Gfo/Idh/MocA family oxidoreductase [Planctomycetota bacterium]
MDDHLLNDRRKFVLASAGAAGLALTASGQESDLKPLRVAVMGLSRGAALATDFSSIPGVEVTHICDVDRTRMGSLAKQLQKKTEGDVKQEVDFRKILADPSVDVLVCAAPNHWHAPATIMACKAGKHVYVEKPCSHNPLEGEWMVEAAEKYKRVVQMGTQRRSAKGTQTAMQRLHDGAIGKVHLARCYYHNLRGSIGKGSEGEPPNQLDYDLWQGPALHRPYRTNLVHYNWHWFWHWGGGELANNGVHGLDLCRWGLQVDFPTRTVCSGGRYWYEDDQETPDTQSACFEFEGNKQITWDALSCNKHGPGLICSFYGDQGALELESEGVFRRYDRNDKLVEEGMDKAIGQKEHLQNFVEAVRAGDASLLNQPITEGHKSTLLCHLGNIAYRTGRTVRTDSSNGHILEDQQQQEMWRREYEPSWESDVQP